MRAAHRSIAPIYLDTVSLKKGQWFWSLTAHGPHISRNIGKTLGFEDTARLAGKAVEDAWFAAIKGSKYDTQKPPPNGYAAAKDPG